MQYFIVLLLTIIKAINWLIVVCFHLFSWSGCIIMHPDLVAPSCAKPKNCRGGVYWWYLNRSTPVTPSLHSRGVWLIVVWGLGGPKHHKTSCFGPPENIQFPWEEIGYFSLLLIVLHSPLVRGWLLYFWRVESATKVGVGLRIRADEPHPSPPINADEFSLLRPWPFCWSQRHPQPRQTAADWLLCLWPVGCRLWRKEGAILVPFTPSKNKSFN